MNIFILNVCFVNQSFFFLPRDSGSQNGEEMCYLVSYGTQAFEPAKAESAHEEHQRDEQHNDREDCYAVDLL